MARRSSGWTARSKRPPLETARRKIAGVEAAIVVARADILKADGQIQEAEGTLQQTVDELETKQELHRRNPGNVPFREIEKLEVRRRMRRGVRLLRPPPQNRPPRCGLSERSSGREGQRRSGAGAGPGGSRQDRRPRRRETGAWSSSSLRVGDIVNPLMRPAGVLIPEGAGQRGLQAGFGQIEAQIMKVGMIAEVTCVSKPWTIIPMVVTDVQDFIAAGQFRGGEQLIDAQQVTRPGTLLVSLEPLYEGGLDGVTPGSSCIANAYSNNHDMIAAKETGAVKRVVLHAVDALGLCMRSILRLQASCFPSRSSCSADTSAFGARAVTDAVVRCIP